MVYHAPECRRHQRPRRFVPQAIYRPQPDDIDIDIPPPELQPPLLFLTSDSPEWGVPVSQLLSQKPISLVGGNEPAFTSSGSSIDVHLNWPGYRSFHKLNRSYARQRHLISKAKLATYIARFVKDCMDDMSNQEMEEGSDPGWKVGPEHISADDILLLSLHNISQDGWQPQLRLLRVTDAAVDDFRFRMYFGL